MSSLAAELCPGAEGRSRQGQSSMGPPARRSNNCALFPQSAKIDDSKQSAHPGQILHEHAHGCVRPARTDCKAPRAQRCMRPAPTHRLPQVANHHVSLLVEWLHLVARLRLGLKPFTCLASGRAPGAPALGAGASAASWQAPAAPSALQAAIGSSNVAAHMPVAFKPAAHAATAAAPAAPHVRRLASRTHGCAQQTHTPA